MSTLRQIEANRRNARLSTGPVTDEGKRRSRQNALRHGLTGETVIKSLEEAEDYAAFEMAITADYDAESVVERELVLRLASLLWRLQRATAIETGLFEIQARQLLQFRQARRSQRKQQDVVDSIYRAAIASDKSMCSGDDQEQSDRFNSSEVSTETGRIADNITGSFVRLSNLPTCPLDRLSRYEAALWRQACQILFTLQGLSRRKSSDKLRFL
jgi:hypothetical protein